MPHTSAPPGGQAGRGRDARETRDKILAIAQELFAGQGYAGASIADIAARLGTSKAALYYHFRSKAEILRALLEGPAAAYARLTASSGAVRSAQDLLRAVIDTTADLHALADVIGNDPSAQSVLRELLPLSRDINTAIIAALAEVGPASTVRAHAAYAAAKNGTLTLLAANGGHLSQHDRAELLDAAMRALANPRPAAKPAEDSRRPAAAG
jgi:AcrR family transcriptional regulator